MNSLFILGCHKSGTSLFRALLDGHKELFVIPFETHFFSLVGEWIRYPLRPVDPIAYSGNAAKERLLDWLRVVNSGTGASSFGDNQRDQILDLEKFNKKFDFYDLNKERTALFRDSYVRFIDALKVSMFGGRHDGTHRWSVEKSVEHTELATAVGGVMPTAKFIHVIRNPYANLVAIRRKSTSGWFLGPPLLAIEQSLYLSLRNYLALGPDRYKVVRYEEIIQNTEATMRAVAEWLEIEFAEQLLTPTSGGELWKGNSTSREKFEAVSSLPLDRWRKEITTFEISLINATLKSALERLGYQSLTPSEGKQRHPTYKLPALLMNLLFLTYMRRRARHELIP